MKLIVHQDGTLLKHWQCISCHL